MISGPEKYLRPASVAEAIDMAKTHQGQFRFLAGGTDLLPNWYQGNAGPKVVIDLTSIGGLKEISMSTSHVTLGCGLTLDEICRHPIISAEFPLISEAAISVASPLIRKSATLVGNLLCENRCMYFNQSEWWRSAIGFCLKCQGDVCIATGGSKACFSRFVSDTAPALICLKAEVEIAGEGWLPVEELYSSEGVNPLRISKDNLISSIRIPLQKPKKYFFRKLRIRESMDFTSLTIALVRFHGGHIRIGISGVDPGPVLLECELGEPVESIVKSALKKCRVVDNDTFSRHYKREMIPVFIKEALG